MIDKQNLPLFVHCVDGAHTTGTIIMCLRKLQNWSLSVIFNEFIRFTRDNSINSTESDFVETFKREIMVPVSIPKWLWEGDRHSSVSCYDDLVLTCEAPNYQGQTHPRQ